ncbi:MAG: hypothetical protein U1F06_10665 [Steroidobacteraceae bacterium]
MAAEPNSWLHLPSLKTIWYPPARIWNGRFTFFMWSKGTEPALRKASKYDGCTKSLIGMPFTLKLSASTGSALS